MKEQQQVTTKFNVDENYKLFYNTICSLSNSQGFYGRVMRALGKLSDDELVELKNELPLFKDSLDVIYYFEQ